MGRKALKVRLKWKVRTNRGVVIASTFSVHDAVGAAITNGKGTSVTYLNSAKLWTFSGVGVGKSKDDFIDRVALEITKRRSAQRFASMVLK